jgi:hypothetical protein
LWALALEHLVALLLDLKRAMYSRLALAVFSEEHWEEPLVAALGLVASVVFGKQPAGLEIYPPECLQKRLSKLLVLQKTCVPVAFLTRFA